MPKVGRPQADPHMKSPFLKNLLIVVIVVLLVIFVAPKVYEIFNDNVNDVDERANNS